MFKPGRPTDDALKRIAEGVSSAGVTYERVGDTLAGDLPPHYQHDRGEVSIGSGAEAFSRGVEGLRSWRAHLGAGARVVPNTEPAEGMTVVVAVPVGPLTAIAPCRIVRIIDDADAYGFAYGTLPGHPEKGEEAFVVRRLASGSSVFAVTAFSRPAELLARAGGPITRRIQQGMTQRYLDALGQWARSPQH